MEISLHNCLYSGETSNNSTSSTWWWNMCPTFLSQIMANVETKCALPGWHDKVEISAFLPCHLKCECSSGSGSGSGRGSFFAGMTSLKGLAKVSIVKSLLMQCEEIYGNMLYNSNNYKHNDVDGKPASQRPICYIMVSDTELYNFHC